MWEEAILALFALFTVLNMFLMKERNKKDEIVSKQELKKEIIMKAQLPSVQEEKPKTQDQKKPMKLGERFFMLDTPEVKRQFSLQQAKQFKGNEKIEFYYSILANQKILFKGIQAPKKNKVNDQIQKEVYEIPKLKKIKSNQIKKIAEESQPIPNFLSVLQSEEQFNQQRKQIESEEGIKTIPIKKLVLTNLKSQLEQNLLEQQFLKQQREIEENKQKQIQELQKKQLIEEQQQLQKEKENGQINKVLQPIITHTQEIDELSKTNSLFSYQNSIEQPILLQSFIQNTLIPVKQNEGMP